MTDRADGSARADDDEPPRAQLLGEGSTLVLLGAAIADIAPDLTPGEAAMVARAVPKRVRELAAGRALARRALVALGRSTAEILSTPDRDPIWPSGVAGSISHTDDYCAVVLGEAGSTGHVGLDVEGRGNVPVDLWSLTFVDEEIAFLETLSGSARTDAAAILFSAKEAFYKAQYPRTRVILSFHDVTIRLEADGSFTAALNVVVRGITTPMFSGRFAVCAQRVWSLCRVPAQLDR